jgi:drug/metabolite transporter (DMT)-like permease
LWLICLALFTGLSRLALFNGVRSMGSIQTILLNMADLGVTLVLARIFLHEMLTGWQWLGVAMLVISVALSNWEKDDGQIVYKPLPQPQRFHR